MTTDGCKKRAELQVLIVAGEASGDLHGGNLLRAAADAYPQISITGVGGNKMKAAGCDIMFLSDELSVMGVQEVFAALPRIMRRFRQIKKRLQSDNKPDLLALIDFPDFNLRLAKVAKANGIPVLYFISSKVWAWRSGRAKVIATRVDRLALIFPFESQNYQPFGVQTDYVDNPLLDEFQQNQPRGDLRQRLACSAEDQIVGVFPGSRKNELQYILDSLVQTAEMIHAEKPAAQFVVPIAPSLSSDDVPARFGDTNLPVHFVEENIYEVAAACDAALTVSGTVTLQLALTRTPMAIVYKVAALSYAIGRRLIKIKFAGLTNIVAGRGIIKEFIQQDAAPVAMCREIIRLLDDNEYRARMQSDLEGVCQRLGDLGCSQRVADIVAEMIGLREQARTC